MNTKTYNKFLAIFKSRKFWACFLAVLTSVGAYRSMETSTFGKWSRLLSPPRRRMPPAWPSRTPAPTSAGTKLL